MVIKLTLPKRKDIRFKNHDYSQNGAYFITVCVKDRHNLLWENNVGAISDRPFCHLHKLSQLSDIGKIIDDEIHKIGAIYDNVLIDKYVIMPNHIHMIIILKDNEDGRQDNEDGRPKVAPTISRIMQQFKGSISKQVGFPMWQKSFYDHIIRNEEEYQKIWEYIDTNPLKWQEDCYYQNDNAD
jgi:putative transposase